MSRVAPVQELLSQNQLGLTENVNDLSETPNQMLTRTLLPGEQVLREFNCYFPSDFIPLWKLVRMLILTCGFYIFVLAYRAVARWCYRHNCCKPNIVEFERGKLAVTNLGRVICWSTKTYQLKIKGCCFCCGLCGDTCAAPVQFSVHLETRIYDANKLRQITMYHKSKALLIWCCINSESALKVTFNEFSNHEGIFISSGVGSGIIHTMRTYLGNMEHYFGLTSNDHTVYVYSATEDIVHKSDSKTTVEDLANLQIQFLNLLPQQQDIVVRNEALNVGDYSFTDETSGFNMLGASGKKLVLSRKWFNLSPGEQIYSVCSEVYIMSIWDIILTVLSFGCHYICYVKEAKKTGGILVLTNKRVVEIAISSKKYGVIPASLNNVSVSVSSFFPGPIHGGFMVSRGKNHR
jgi:hypothetical protein